MILLIIFYPTLKIGKLHFSTFYFPLLLVALIFLIFPVFDKSELQKALFTNNPINPLKILILFLSVSVLSIGLDKSGFFSFLASWSIKKVKQLYNPSLVITGILVTMYNGRLNLSVQVMDELKKYYADKLFDTVITRNVRLTEAPSFGTPAYHYDRNSKGSQAYFEVSKELLDRI